jgi:CcmD family protein
MTRIFRWSATGLLLGALLVTEGVSWGASPQGGDYQPYVAPQAEILSTPLFVLIAYSAIWIVLLIFVGSVWRRQRRVEAELELLRQRLGGDR